MAAGDRVFVGAMGTINPLGHNVKDTWEGMLAGRSGVARITNFDPDEAGLQTKIAGEVKNLDPTNYMDRKEARRLDRFAILAMVAAGEMMQEVDKWDIKREDLDSIGVIVASGVGGLTTITEQVEVLAQKGPSRVGPFTVPMLMSNAAAANISMKSGFRGLSFATLSACAGSADAIGTSYGFIKLGWAEAIVSGGSEASLIPIGIASFNQITALCTDSNDAPEKASRPFDATRSGFVMSEGAAVLFLMSESFAKRYNVPVLAELAGYGASADAYHITAPPDDGNGAVRAIKMALQVSGLRPEEIDYINAHGTSTQHNDRAETVAVKTVFGERAYGLPISSTKSMTGHLVGAGGALEAIATVQTIRTGWMPPTINYETPDADCDLDYIPNVARQGAVRAAISNSFGFGGHNSCLVFRLYEE
ncbi:MAG: beta-ketoacyl-[acyl-carrier-protein] synthase II [Dehalococcoidia bacterium]|nr:beta-ketoacyl-[acyl-carrier-protein] synthase II [Dehalococcoidia bacterium]